MFCTTRQVRRRSAVRQPIFLDVVAIGLEQHVGPPMIADLLRAAFDHAVAFARLLVQNLPGSSDLEALFRARLGLQLGHLALLCERSICQATIPADPATWGRLRPKRTLVVA